MKRKELERQLRRSGWWLLREGKRHALWTDGHYEIAVPRHAKISEGTARAILKLARRGSE